MAVLRKFIRKYPDLFRENVRRIYRDLTTWEPAVVNQRSQLYEDRLIQDKHFEGTPVETASRTILGRYDFNHRMPEHEFREMEIVWKLLNKGTLDQIELDVWGADKLARRPHSTWNWDYNNFWYQHKWHRERDIEKLRVLYAAPNLHIGAHLASPEFDPVTEQFTRTYRWSRVIV